MSARQRLSSGFALTAGIAADPVLGTAYVSCATPGKLAVITRS